MSFIMQKRKKKKGEKTNNERTTKKKNHATGTAQEPTPIILQNFSSFTRSRALVNMSAAISAVAQYGMVTFDDAT